MSSLARRRGLKEKLGPLKPKFTTEEQAKMAEFGKLLSSLKYDIVHMDYEAAKSIYDGLDRDIEYLLICPLYKIWDREVILVIFAKFEGDSKETLINQRFYRSTGMSRHADIKNIWFPGGELDFGCKRIAKLEDTYYQNLFSAAGSTSILVAPSHVVEPVIVNGKDIIAHPEVGQYKRFITKKYSAVSKYLYHNNDFLEPILAPLPNYKNVTPSPLDQTLLNVTTEEVVTYDEFDAEVNRNIEECRKGNYLQI